MGCSHSEIERSFLEHRPDLVLPKPDENPNKGKALRVKIINVGSGRRLYAWPCRKPDDGEETDDWIGLGATKQGDQPDIWLLSCSEKRPGRPGAFRIISERSKRALFARSGGDNEEGLGASVVGKYPEENEDSFWVLIFRNYNRSGVRVQIVNLHSHRFLYADEHQIFDAGIGAKAGESADDNCVWDIVPVEKDKPGRSRSVDNLMDLCRDYTVSPATDQVSDEADWDPFPNQDCFPGDDAFVKEFADADPEKLKEKVEQCKDIASKNRYEAFTIVDGSRASFRCRPADECRQRMVPAADNVVLYILRKPAQA